ncbi:MAG: insulinase family protein [Chryseobacterium sp.]|nr:MAG: insulinase family protein [Chryseobacterium sp.]
MTTDSPFIAFSMTIPGGQLAQASDLSKAGLPSFFADMMQEDTKNYTSEQLALELQKLGSTISILSDVDGITYTVQSLKKNFDKTMALLQERMFNPAFKQTDFDPNIRIGLIKKISSVFYEVKDDRIEILFFWDNRQEPMI